MIQMQTAGFDAAAAILSTQQTSIRQFKPVDNFYYSPQMANISNAQAQEDSLRLLIKTKTEINCSIHVQSAK